MKCQCYESQALRFKAGLSFSQVVLDLVTVVVWDYEFLWLSYVLQMLEYTLLSLNFDLWFKWIIRYLIIFSLLWPRYLAVHVTNYYTSFPSWSWSWFKKECLYLPIQLIWDSDWDFFWKRYDGFPNVSIYSVFIYFYLEISCCSNFGCHLLIDS